MNKFIGLFAIFAFVFLEIVVAQDITYSKNVNSKNAMAAQDLIRGPYLQVVTSNSVMIRWRTANSSRSRVRYGSDKSNLNLVTDDSTLTNEHKVNLKALSPLTRYYYAICSFKDTLQGDAENFFETLPVPGETSLYRIGVFGDCGNNSVNQRSVRDQFIKYLGDKYMNAWILLGDNAYSEGTDAEFQAKFFNIYKDNLLKKYPLYPSPGNHDYGDAKYAAAGDYQKIAYFQNFSMPLNGEAGGFPSHNPAFYSFDIGNAHFLSLDSYGKEENAYKMYDTLGPQVQWIKKDLESNANKGWVIAYWHHPPYTMGSHNSDKEGDLVKIRENFIRILERYGVDLILCGHSHLYERSKLMKGHYGMEASFNTTEHVLNTSSALYDGSNNSCPYIKDSSSNYQGTVYVVTGSAGSLGKTQTSFPYDAMQYSYATLGGASILEIEGSRLELKWICSDGQIRDHFTMMKNVNRKNKIAIKKGQSITLTASFIGKYKWNKSKETTKSITIIPPSGKSTYTVQDEMGCVKDSFEIAVSR
jgi:hypothetical protein